MNSLIAVVVIVFTIIAFASANPIAETISKDDNLQSNSTKRETTTSDNGSPVDDRRGKFN